MANNLLKDVDAWHRTKEGLLIFGIVELILAYIIGSRAIETGSLWQYALTIILFVGGLKNLIKLVINLFHGNKHKAKKA